MTVGVYCRVSTDLQMDKGESIPDQKRLGKEFAHSQGWDYQYYEDAQSGKNPTRAGFVQLRNDVLSGKIQAVWIKNHYRLAREALTALSFIGELEQLYRQHNEIPLFILNRKYDYDDPTDKMVFTFWAAIAENEGRQIVERTTRGRNHKYENGGMHVRRLYGYYRAYNNQTGKTEYHINEQESKIVKEIIDRVIKGQSFREIARDLSARYILTPEGNKQWRPTTVARIADQKLYAGYYDYHDKKNILSYLYTPIIDWSTYRQAKRATDTAIQRKKGTTNKTRHNHHMLTTIFDCWYCGGSIYYAYDKRYGYQYYKVFHSKNGCSRRYKHQTMRFDDAEYWVIFRTLDFLLDRDTRWNLYEKQKSETTEKKEYYNEEVEKLDKEIKRIRTKKNVLLDKDFDDTDVLDKIDSLAKQQKELEKQKKNIEINLAKQDEQLDNLLTELMKDSTDEFLEATQFKKRKMLLNWIKHGWIKDDTLIIEWITGRVDKLPQYRKVFKSKEWQDIKATVANVPLTKIYSIYENMDKERKGETLPFTKIIQDMQDKNLIQPLDK